MVRFIYYFWEVFQGFAEWYGKKKFKRHLLLYKIQIWNQTKYTNNILLLIIFILFMTTSFFKIFFSFRLSPVVDQKYNISEIFDLQNWCCNKHWLSVIFITR